MKKKFINGIIAVVVIVAAAMGLYYLMKDVREESRADEKRAEELNSSGSAVLGESEIDSGSQSESFYGKLSAGQSVSILVLGDSIGAGAGIEKEEEQWWNLLAAKLQEKYGSQVKIKNKAEEGTTTYAGYVTVKTMRDSTDYDLIILCFGNRESTEDYTLYGECLVRAVRSRYPGGSILCVQESGMSDQVGKEDVLAKLEKQYRFLIADMVEPMDREENKASLEAERGLLDAKGQQVYADTMLGAIENRIQFGEEDKRGEIACLEKMAGRFENCQYVYAKKLHKPDDTSFLAKGAAYAVVGIDMDYKKGDSMSFYVDDAEIPVQLSDFTDTEEQRLIVPIIDVINIQESIKITFNSKEAAKRFRGFIINSVSN